MTKGENMQFRRRQLRKKLNRADDPSSRVRISYGDKQLVASSNNEVE